jgi:hypothetical protein
MSRGGSVIGSGWLLPNQTDNAVDIKVIRELFGGWHLTTVRESRISPRFWRSQAQRITLQNTSAPLP